MTLDALLAAPDLSRVIAVTRRPLGIEHPRLANRIVQFERLESQLKGTLCEVALCCLGTTLRKAGSQQRFRTVDVDCVLTFARAAKAANARRFVVMSSVGANPNARNFYLRTKGEMEEDLEGVGFESLDILQPSMLLAWRAEMRPLELVASAFMPLARTATARQVRALPGDLGAHRGRGHARRDALGAPRRAALYLRGHPGARAPHRRPAHDRSLPPKRPPGLANSTAQNFACQA